MAYDENLCNERHKRIDEKLTNIENLLITFNNKLFVDNGGESYQSKMNRIDGWIKRVCAVVGLICVPVLLLIIRAVIELFLQ